MLENQLEFDFTFGCNEIGAEYYREGAQDLIQRLIPRELLDEKAGIASQQRARFADLLPLLSWSSLEKAPCTLSVLLLCKYRLNACNFFHDMVSRWLLPQKRVNVELFFASDVRLPHLSEDLLSVAEIVISLRSASDVEEARRHQQALETEIRLGVVSNYHARRILEFKGLSSDGKTAMIQEKIGSLIQSHSKDFDKGMFSQMQQFLVTWPEEFKTARDYHHMSRMISNLYSLRKLLEQNQLAFPKKRQVFVKFFKTQIQTPGQKQRQVLGVLAGLNVLGEHEVFETSHLTSAIQKILPCARFVEGSSFVEKAMEKEPLQTMYLEVEKPTGGEYSLEEIQILRKALPDSIKAHIERLTRPIFMPRNDEEVLRNIMALSRQLRFVHDLPQVTISFDEQKGNDLFFTVILLRIFSEGTLSVQELLQKSQSPLTYIPDRIRRLGQVRKRYAKEATVFRVSLSNRSFLRPDLSIDLYKARLFLFQELTRSLGELRDYNGGMLHKQTEQLDALKLSLGKTGEQNLLLLEKFYHALSPMEMRTSLDIEPMKQLFSLLLQSMKPDFQLRHKSGDWLLKQEKNQVFAAIPVLGSRLKKRWSDFLEKLSLAPHQLVSVVLEHGDVTYLGYLLLTDDASLQERFLKGP